jgi:hypothetical protein
MSVGVAPAPPTALTYSDLVSQPGYDELENELDEKLKLAEFSYGEVLDATKHQDDKIGRMITSVAFLTAAALALAALGAAKFVTRRFVVSPYNLPLGLITLVVFLVGVIFTVLLLLASLATPLRIPGIGDNNTQKRKRPQQWVRDVPTSQLYFYAISGVSLTEWEKKWGAPAEELKEERLESFVREVHNLGSRTTFKYDRSTEALSILSFSLLALGLAAAFIAVAAGTEGEEPVVLEPIHRLLIGLLLGAYSALQLLTRIRYDRPGIDALPPSGRTRTKNTANRAQRFGQTLLATFAHVRTFALLFGAFVTVGALSDQGWTDEPGWVVTVSVLYLATMLSFCMASPNLIEPVAGVKPIRRLGQELWARLLKNQLTLPFFTVVAGPAVITFASLGWYGPQLFAIVGLVFMLNLVQAMEPTLALTERRQRFHARNTAGT